MTQRKLDELFSQSLSNKRSRTNNPKPTINRDEFDDLFETNSSTKRRRTNMNQPTDVPMPSSGSLKKKRSLIIDDEENKAIDDLFNNDTRKKLRRPIKNEESIDLLDMFHTRTDPTPQTILTIDDFKPPTTQKKIKMFFDDTDLVLLREQNDTKDYTQIKPVLITGGQWLSKQAETKSTCGTTEVPDDERNLMHIQYAPLFLDDEIVCKKKSKHNSKNLLDGKSFHKQLVLSDSAILRKENLQSCYNALLEDINKPRTTSSSTISKSLNNDDDQIDFFDLPTRRKKL